MRKILKTKTTLHEAGKGRARSRDTERNGQARLEDGERGKGSYKGRRIVEWTKHVGLCRGVFTLKRLHSKERK